MNGFNLSNITDARLGGAQLSAIYLGSSKLWPLGHDYSQDYFTIEALEHTMIRLHKNTTSGTKRKVAFSRNNGMSWNQLATEYDKEDYAYDYVELSAGEKVCITASDWPVTTTSDYAYFTSSNSINVYGNVNSVRDSSFKTNKTMPAQDYWFYRLFYKLKIVDASNLVLPYTTLRNYCYLGMFEGCTTLTNAPAVLPATSVSYYSYSYMFSGCTSLTEPPQLKGTTLAGYAYSNMFDGCTSLTKLPKLNHITTITYWAPFRYMFSNCRAIEDARYDVDGNRLLPDRLTVTSGGSAYELMFNGCTGLKYAPELTETSPHTGEYNQMFAYCTNSEFLNIYTHATSLGTNYFSNIVKGTNHSGNISRADDVTWDSAQYSQFNYTGSGTSASRWAIRSGGYNSGDYQT